MELHELFKSLFYIFYMFQIVSKSYVCLLETKATHFFKVEKNNMQPTEYYLWGDSTIIIQITVAWGIFKGKI